MERHDKLLANIERYRRFLEKDLDPEIRTHAERALAQAEEALVNAGSDHDKRR